MASAVVADTISQTVTTRFIVITPVRSFGVFIVALHLLAFFFPDNLWGVHYLSFTPVALRMAILAFAGVTIVFPNHISIPEKLSLLLSDKQGSLRWLWLPAGLMLMAFLFNSFPIALDEYGDAFQYRSSLNTTPSKLPKKFYKELFSASFLPSMGRKTILYIYGLIAYSNDLTYQEVFKWAGIISGIGYTIIWIGFIKYYLSNYKWQLLMIGAGLFAPFTQIFYGHTETYAPVFFALTSWLALLLVQHKKKSGTLLFFLFVGLIVCFRLHPFCILIVPAWLLSVVQFYRIKNGKKSISYRTSWQWFIIPIFLLGLVLYFFVFKDFNDPRFLDDVRDIDRLFLPILSPDYPLDRYNLLSWNHFLDFFNAMLSWSGAAWLLALGIPVLFKDKLVLRNPSLIILSTTFLLFTALLFMINPLVSMPMDWDLFSFPAPVLLLMVVLLISQIEKLETPSFFMPSAVALLLVASPFFVVNASDMPLSNRLESVGKRMYKTYYLHSSRVIITALGIPDNMTLYLSRKQEILDELKPIAVPGKDPMYANLLMDDGYYYLTVTKEYEKAEARLAEAIVYNPDSKVIADFLSESKTRLAIENNESSKGWSEERIEKEGLNLLRKVRDYPMARAFFEDVRENNPDNPVFAIYLMEACFVLEDYPAALEQALFLVEKSYPNDKKALRIAINCALESEDYEAAKKYASLYVELFPNDKTISTINQRLQNNDRIESLVKIFRL
jgi:tetratricopeptide (TPR) repeat protein